MLYAVTKHALAQAWTGARLEGHEYVKVVSRVATNLHGADRKAVTELVKHCALVCVCMYATVVEVIFQY